ncbi:unnamed protein product [Brassica rapa subsp. trilocularis]
MKLINMMKFMMKKRSYHHLNPLSMVKMKMKKKKFNLILF